MPSSTASESVLPSTASGAEIIAQNSGPDLPVASQKRLHLPYLDGIRALMALYVMHHHLLSHAGVPRLPLGTGFPIQLLREGHYAVVVFIVLSGYCLMLPVLRDDGALRGGLKNFFARRARRILPPYYAALAISAILLAILAVVTHRPWGQLTSPKSWALHLLLLHNLTRDHILDFNGPMWSIATEWQIYFFFPFLFLPVWKRFGEGALLLVAGGIAGALMFLFPSIARACPWFLALFALGMVAAKMSLESPAWIKSVPWGWAGFLLSVVTYFAMRTMPVFHWRHIYILKGELGWYPLSDVAFGLATLCFLLHGTRATLENRRSKFVSLLTWRPLVFIGAFSYSLYLIHTPILNVVVQILSPYHLQPTIAYWVLMLIGVPLILALSYWFYQLFEKPFIGAPKPKAVRPKNFVA